MASGETLLVLSAQAAEPYVADLSPGLDVRNSHPVLGFDATVSESVLWTAVLPRHYTARGFTVTIMWAATTATSGTVRWMVNLERIADEQHDLDVATIAFIEVDAVAPAVSGQVQYTAVPVAHVVTGGIVPGELCRLWVSRLSTHANDTLVGDAELLAIEVRET